MQARTKILVMVVAGLLTATLAADAGEAREAGDLATRLLGAAEGLQMPGSEADSSWWFVSYPGEEELPSAGRMDELSGCTDYPDGIITRYDFDATFDSLGRIQPWMDRGQRESARGFARLGRLFHREYGDDLAVYRCDTNMYGEVRIYFLGKDGEGLSGLMTINIET